MKSPRFSILFLFLAAAAALACTRYGPPDCGGRYPVDLRGSKVTTAFHLLGELDEYLGRQQVAGSDVVETFSCNQSSVAQQFKQELLRFASEQGIDPALSEERFQNCATRLHSVPLNCALNSLYDFKREEGTWATDAPSGRRRDIYRAAISMRRFAGLPREARLAYLAGAHARFGQGADAFSFSNSQQKTLVVERLLRDIGCSNVTLVRDTGRIPQTTIIRFQPTNELSDYLKSHS